MTARDYQDKLLIDKGKFDMAIEFKKELGVVKAAEISGFSIEELEKEEMKK